MILPCRPGNGHDHHGRPCLGALSLNATVDVHLPRRFYMAISVGTQIHDTPTSFERNGQHHTFINGFLTQEAVRKELMKRRIVLIATAAVMATVGVFATPASAHTDACVGTGNATVTAGLGFPPVLPLPPTGGTTADFTFSFTAGTCAVDAGLSAFGTVRGYCGWSTGTGTANGNHAFAFSSRGTVAVLAGELTGVASIVPDPLGGALSGSCTTFLVTGAVVLGH